MRRKLSEEIRHYELKYAYIHGGKKFNPRGKGARQTALTFLHINSVATSKLLILLHLVFSTNRLIFYTQVFIQHY